MHQLLLLMQILQDHAKHGLQQLHMPALFWGRRAWRAWPWALAAAQGHMRGVGARRAFFLPLRPRRAVPRLVAGVPAVDGSS